MKSEETLDWNWSARRILRCKLCGEKLEGTVQEQVKHFAEKHGIRQRSQWSVRAHELDLIEVVWLDEKEDLQRKR